MKGSSARGHAGTAASHRRTPTGRPHRAGGSSPPPEPLAGWFLRFFCTSGGETVAQHGALLHPQGPKAPPSGGCVSLQEAVNRTRTAAPGPGPVCRRPGGAQLVKRAPCCFSTPGICALSRFSLKNAGFSSCQRLRRHPGGVGKRWNINYGSCLNGTVQIVEAPPSSGQPSPDDGILFLPEEIRELR